jgi:hypothetical protein
VTDAVLVEAESVTTVFQPTELSRIESAGEEAGETVREFVGGASRKPYPSSHGALPPLASTG